MQYNVGDKVVGTKEGNPCRVGTRGRISMVDPQDKHMTYYVAFESGEGLWVYNEDIELAGEWEAKRQSLAFQSLTLEEVEQVFNSLPGGLEGFCKGWGWYDFARGIELLSKQKNGG